MNPPNLTNGPKDYSSLTAKELIRVVTEEYTKNINESLDMIVTLLESAHRVEPGEEEVNQILESMKKLRECFREHSAKEVKLLFPLIYAGASRGKDDQKVTRQFMNKAGEEHSWMKTEMERIKKLTLAYHVSVSASPSHKLAYAQMNDLEQDLRRITFVEEEYIYPKILRLFNK